MSSVRSVARRLGLVLVGVLFASCGWAQAPYDLEIVRADLPAAMDPGEDQHVTVTLANRGARTWIPEAGFAVAAHWFRGDGEVMVWDGPRTSLPEPVDPGQTVTVDVLVRTPTDDGLALIQFDVVEEGVLWLSQRAPTPPALMPVSIVRSHAFALIESEMPAWSRAGDRVRTRVRLRNEGRVPWEPDGTFAVAAHWQRPGGGDTIWEGQRTRFPSRVSPGESIALSADVLVPTDAGTWLLQWDVVHEGVCWFSDRAANRPPPDVVVVLPSCSEGWPAVGLTLALAMAAAGVARGWWSANLIGRNLDLIWMVTVPWLAEHTVTVVGFSGSLISLACLVCLAACVNIVPGPGRRLVAWCCGAAVIILLGADRMYLRFFQDLPSVGSIAGIGQLDTVEASILSLVGAGDAALFSAALLGLFVWAPLRGVAPHPGSTARRLAGAGLALAGVLLTLGCAGRAPTVRQVFRRVFVANELGVIGAHVVDLGELVVRKVTAQGFSASDREGVEQWFRVHEPERSGAGPFFGFAADLNLLMIQAESLQAFVPGLMVEGQEVTPTLNRWMRNSVVFDNVTDQTGHGRSSDAELLTQVSLLPLVDGVAAFAAAGNRYTSLAGVLADRGYLTLSAVPFDRTFWNRSVTHPAYGYSVNLFAEDFAPGEMVGWGLGDRVFLSRMGARLADLPEPFCVWLITLSLHHPFDGFPEHLRELHVGRWEGSPVGAYLHTMRYFDRALADLEEQLARSGLIESTVIAIWGDHDAGFGWTPDVAALMGVAADEAGWYVSQRVPLIIRLPAHLGLATSRSTPAGHVDVAPTLAALLGVDPGEMAWMGRNLLGVPGDEPVVGEYACWLDGRHVFLQGDGTLDGGMCLDGADLASQPVRECAAAFEVAAERTRIAQRVLHHDLQEDLTMALQADSP